ncbi:MAG: glycosyltransferase family 1 protein, partial [Flavobacterium sp.]
MRILLLGEYSRLHNSLKEGLVALGHEVIIVSTGDGFKNYPADHTIRAKWCLSRLGNIPRQIIFRLFRFDIAALEHGLRFYFLLPKLKGVDIIQLINECTIKTTKELELLLLKRVFQQNGRLFLLSCGSDYLSIQFLLAKRNQKSILQPYFENPSLKKEYQYILDYTSSKQHKIHNYIYEKCVGVIASDFDYVLPLKGNEKFLGLIPNPINTDKLNYNDFTTGKTIVIFLGINQWNYNQKGIGYFEKALTEIKKKYPQKTEIIITKNIPYKDYINL